MFRRKDIIEAIWREGGFSKAAAALHISQPSLSVTVSTIEKEIGARLFDRSTSPIRLTQIGEKYLECSAGISQIEEDFVSYVNEIKGLNIGSILLGGSTLYISNVIPGILSAYSELHPLIQIRLIDQESTILTNRLLSGEIDIALDNLPDHDKLDRHYLGTEFLFFAVPEDNPLNERLTDYAYSYQEISHDHHLRNAPRFLPDLYPFRNQKFILLQDGFDTRKRTDSVLNDYGITVRTIYELNQLYSAFGTAASGLGITVVSDTLIKSARNWASRMKYYAVRNPEFTRNVYYFTRKNRLLPMAIKEFIDISQELRPFTVYYDEL